MTMKLRVATGALLWFLFAGLSAGTLDDAQSLLQTGQAERALTLIDEHLQAAPDDDDGLFLRARALTALGRPGAAERAYRQLIEQQPQRVEAYNNLAALLMEQEQLTQASQVLEQALTGIDPAYATVYRNLQTVNVEIARASYGKALRVDVPEQRVTLATLELDLDEPPRPAASAPPEKGETQQQPADVVETTPSPTIPLQESEPAAIEQTVRDWARAWAAQDVGRYLSFYAGDFRPDDGLTRQGWEQQRQVRLKRPEWIRVELEKLQIAEQSAQQAVVEFIQKYRSDTYGDVTHKQLILSRENNGWRISRENTL
ncbi:tetratricopeptide repeat protein [Thiohalophilus sp.]|uniref:nuclear transport factor 2 family protein n=1 Tax=Thiohalophilus sp. TaxID=3028392 RepID=UPI002ACED6C7|nr:tetratricopeptide repeat protein [Thiohalophilus sp.]MDZ7803889.1 tetratricopeptide repeat protein [Thiohalophilus sp.]